MTAPFSKIVNEKHDQKVLAEQQDQVIKLINSRRKETPAKKKHFMVDIILAIVFVVSMAVAFYVSTANHRGDPSINGAPISEMSISDQLTEMEEARYNDN